MATRLLNNVSVDTTGNAIDCTGGPVILTVWATAFGSGVVTPEISSDGGDTWIGLTKANTPVAITANTALKIDYLAQGLKIRAKLSSSNGSTSGVYAQIN